MSSPVFKTQEEEELAKKLGFNMPQPKRPAPTTLPVAETYVVGYFNPNPWPISIQISELGLTIPLSQRNDYVMDNQGRKINDPLLEQYVGPMRLAREVSPTKVGIRRFPPLSKTESLAPGAVSSAEKFVKGPNGQMVPVMRPTAEIVRDNVTLPTPGTGPAVLGFPGTEGKEMAERLRLIKPTRIIVESPVADTDGTPVGGEHLPVLDYAEDMRPSEVRALRAKQAQEAAAVKVPAPPAKTAESPDIANVDANVPESQEQAQIIESLKAAASVDILGADVTKLMPKLDEAPAPAPAPPVDVNTTVHKFTCPLCPGIGFQFRSILDRHVRSTHPESYDEVMASYPKKA